MDILHIEFSSYLKLISLFWWTRKEGGNVDTCDNALLGLEEKDLKPVGLLLVDDGKMQLSESLVSRAIVS